MLWSQIFEKEMAQVEKKIKQFEWENPDVYAQWLGQTYHFVLHSTRILALASARTQMNQYGLHNRFIDHAREERGHENILIRDLKALGKKVEDIPEMASTAALYKTQYYWIEHHSTDAFMGWVILLESVASRFGPSILQRVVQAHGIGASMFWKVHAEEDQDHVKKALNQIAQLPHNNQAQTILNFQHCASYYSNILNECSAFAVRKIKAA